MKKAGLIAIIALGLSPIIIHAQDRGLYVGVDGGPIIQQNATLTSSAGAPQTATFNVGARGGLHLGYNLCSSFAVELESGFMWDSVDDLGGPPLSDENQSIDIYSIPILANFIFKIPTHCGLVPYIGIGGGGNVSIFDFDDKGSRFVEDDIEPAIQGEAGIKYDVTSHASIGIGYKFLATAPERYSVPEISEQIGIHHIYIHSVFAAFTVRF